MTGSSSPFKRPANPALSDIIIHFVGYRCVPSRVDVCGPILRASMPWCLVYARYRRHQTLLQIVRAASCRDSSLWLILLCTPRFYCAVVPISLRLSLSLFINSDFWALLDVSRWILDNTSLVGGRKGLEATRDHYLAGHFLASYE